MKLLTSTALCLGLLTAPAFAGSVVAIGDGNIADNLGTDAGSAQFFTNLLGAGSNVGLLDFTDIGYGSAGDTVSELSAHYTGIGATVSTLIGTVTGAALAGLDLFIAALPDDNFSASEVSNLSNFLNGGGTAVFIGENNVPVFNTANASIAQVLADLGTGMGYVDGCATGGASAVPGGSFNSGAPNVRYACGSFITGGTAEYQSGGRTVIASYQTAPVVPIPAGLPLMLTALGGAAWYGRRRKKAYSV